MSAAIRSRFMVLALLAAVSCSGALAQGEAAVGEPEPAYPSYVQLGPRGEPVLTPDTAARLVVERNIDLAISAEGIGQAQGRLEQARAADRLTAQLQATLLRMGPVVSFTLPGSEDGESVEFGSSHSETLTFSASRPIYTGGRAALGRSLAREGVTSAELSLDSVRRALLLASQEGSYAILRLKQLAAVAASRATAVAEHLRLSEAMEQAGVVAHFEVVQAQTELSKAQGDLISAETGVEQAKAALRNLVDFPQGTEMDVVDGPPPAEPEGGLDELVEMAWQHRPEARLVETGVTLARMNLQLARASLKPSAALTGGFTVQGAASTLQSHESWQFGVGVQKPLFDGGARSGKVAEALAALRSAELQVDKTRESIALDVAQQMLAVAEAKEQSSVAQQGVIEARERRRMSQIRYREGITAGVEVIDADTALAAAEAAQVNAQYDLQLAIVRLQAALGLIEVHEQEGERQ